MPQSDPVDLTARAYTSRATAGNVPLEKARELSEADLELARKQFLSIYEDQHELRARLKADHEYLDGVYPDGKSKRWERKELDERAGRPALSIDAMSGPIAQVTNGLAEARPAADMMPLGRGATDDAAEVWEGLIRRIQTTPEAEYAGAYAAGHLVPLGFGSWVLTAKYPDYNGDPEDPANWEMELCRRWIENQHAVWLGPATEPDGSDRLFGFILQPLTEEQFDERLGAGEYKKNRDVYEQLALGGSSPGMTAWQSERTLTVASWYRVKSTPVTLKASGPDGQPVERVVRHRIVCLSTITATKEYEYSELPIPYIPIVHGIVKRSNIDGAKDVKGMVRAMKDPQDLVNVYPSYIAETVAKGARTEVIAAEGQIDEQNAGFWDLTKRLPYRLYHPLTLDGKFAERPHIENFEPPIQGMTLALQQAESFVRKAALLYDSDSDETGATLSKMSGRALQQRQRQGELGNSDSMRAYQFMVLFEVKLILAWAPHVYSSARALRLSGRDEESFAAVTYFGKQFQPEAEELASGIAPPRGIQKPVKTFDLKQGRYDMKARVIRNPMTQRQENQEIVRDVLPALPPQMQAQVMPILFEEMDGTIGKRIAAAIKGDQGTVPIEEAQQAQQLIDALSEKVNGLQDAIARKDAELASKEKIALAEIASKERIERAKLDTELMLAEYEARKLAAQAEFDAHQAELGRQHTSTEADRGAEREAFVASQTPPTPTNGATA